MTGRILSRIVAWLTSDTPWWMTADGWTRRAMPPTDTWVFRSRQGDVRDTAAAMLPDMED